MSVPSIDAILRDLKSERWFIDGSPKWTLGRAKRPAQTAAEADTDRLTAIKRLRAPANASMDSMLLAVVLEGCRPGNRCTSGACPACGRAFQRWSVATCKDFLASRGKKVAAVHIVPGRSRIPVGKVKGPLFRGAKRRVRKALRVNNIRMALGGCDVSVNEHEAGAFKAHFQPHLVLFATRSLTKRARSRALREHFPKSVRVPRPVLVRAFDGKRAGLAYAFKTSFVRRVTLAKVVTPSGSTMRRRNTRERPLRAKEAVQLMIALDRAGLMSRLFLHGVELVDGPRGPVFRARSKTRSQL